jgi:ABC-type transport system involved in cytochrome bd biosynthesis fused ATPase/permease subunit
MGWRERPLAWRTTVIIVAVCLVFAALAAVRMRWGAMVDWLVPAALFVILYWVRMYFAWSRERRNRR